MEERLSYLFKKYLDNTCSEKELEEFLSYVQKAHNEELLRELIEKVYKNQEKEGINTSTYVDENGDLVLNEPKWIASSQVRVRRKRSLLPALGFAASVVIVAAIIWIMSGVNRTVINPKTPVASLTRKTTDRSEFKYLLLEDGTKVWLNAASTLEFPDHFNTTKREVYLSGEAFFDVQHADKIPFIIYTGDIATTVLGTAFNIKAYPGQKKIIISVSRGKVKIKRKDGWETTLIRRQQVKIEEAGSDISEKNIPENEIAGWQQGNLVYDDETLEDIMADLQRIYNVNIQVADLSINGLKISTSFKREIGVEQALQVLCRLTDTKLIKTEEVYLIQ